jgi:SIR2-like domain
MVSLNEANSEKETIKSFNKNEILILLGAGASFDAEIPHSAAMLADIQNKVENDTDWEKFRDLYYYVESAIRFADEMQGKSKQSNYNIEKLVTTLDEISKRNNHPLFPFIGAWSPRLVEVLGNDFRQIVAFRAQIVNVLRSQWVTIRDNSKIEYYKGVFELQKEYEHSLRIFTLNYDMCIETIQSKVYKDYKLQRGFDSNKKWDWRQFDESEQEDINIYLYKLHGSLDWKREESGSLTFLDSSNHIKASEAEIIFGTTHKLQYLDPFLFLAYEFRRWTLESKLIVCIGYGFADDHINGIIGQALKNSPERKILSVSPSDKSEEAIKRRKSEISKQLSLDESQISQIEILPIGAKGFLESISISNLTKYFIAPKAEF